MGALPARGIKIQRCSGAVVQREAGRHVHCVSSTTPWCPAASLSMQPIFLDLLLNPAAAVALSGGGERARQEAAAVV